MCDKRTQHLRRPTGYDPYKKLWCDEEGYTTEEMILLTELIASTATSTASKEEAELELRILKDRQFEEIFFIQSKTKIRTNTF